MAEQTPLLTEDIESELTEEEEQEIIERAKNDEEYKKYLENVVGLMIVNGKVVDVPPPEPDENGKITITLS